MPYRPPTDKCRTSVPESSVAGAPTAQSAVIARFEALLDRFEELLDSADGYSDADQYEEHSDLGSDPDMAEAE